MNTEAFANDVTSGNMNTYVNETAIRDFAEKASPKEMEAVSQALGIKESDWSSLTPQAFSAKMDEFYESGKVEEIKNRNAKRKELLNISEEAAKEKIPSTLSTKEEGATRYKQGKADIGVLKEGDNYILFDYPTRKMSKTLTRAEAESALDEIRQIAENSTQGEKTGVEEQEIKGTIRKDMTESERYKALKKRKLSLDAEVNYESMHIIDQKDVFDEESFRDITYSAKKELLKKIGEEFEVYKDYSNSDFEIEFSFSKGNLKHSINKQEKNYSYFAKMLSCFDTVVKNAIGIEVHNRNEAGYKKDATLKNVYVLTSAFVDGKDVIPVKLEIKEFRDKKNTLYVAIALESINKDEVVTQGSTAKSSAKQYARSSTISISDFFKKINPSDKSFLKYIPDGFLNAEQKKAKQEALAEDAEKTKSTAKTVSQIVEGETESKVQAVKNDIWAKEHIKEYGSLNALNKSAVRATIRAAQKNNMSEQDVITFARFAAKSALSISFDKTKLVNGIDENGNTTYANGMLLGETVYVNPESKLKYDVLLSHEMFHKLFREKASWKLIKSAIKHMDVNKQREISARYEKYYKKINHGELPENFESIVIDEIAAHYTETVFSDIDVLAYLTEEQPTIKDKIMGFFNKSARTYADDSNLSSAARKFARQYRKLFQQVADRDYQSNSAPALALSVENGEENPVTSTDVDTDTRYAINFLSEEDLPGYLRAGGRANKYKQQAIDNGKKIILTTSEDIREYIEKAIAGEKDLPAVAYGKVDSRLSEETSDYSDGKIQISNYYLELVATDIHHAYQEHLHAKKAGDIDLSIEDFMNIPLYVATYDDFVYAIKYKSGNTKICLSKKISDGRVLVIETVSKSHGSIEFKNMIGVSEEKYLEEYEKKYKKRNGTNTGGSKSSNNSPRDETASNIIIPENSEKSNSFSKKSLENSSEERFSLADTDVEGSKSLKNYSYNELVAKGDLRGITITKKQQVKLTPDGRIDSDFVIKEVRRKCKKNNNSDSPVFYIEVPDIGKNVQITSDGIKHSYIKGLRKNGAKIPTRDLLNARVTLELPEILRNSIEVNISDRGDNPDIPYSHIMMGTVALEDVNGNVEYYAVRSVIEERINQAPVLAELKVFGKLHAINAKKIGSPQARGVKYNVALAGSGTYMYSVADFLKDVKGIFEDTFSNDVYNKLGVTRRITPFSQNLRYSLPEDEDFESPTVENVAKQTEKDNSIKGRIKSFKKNFFTAKDRFYIDTVDEMYGIQKYLDESGDKNAKARIQQARASRSQAQTMIGSVQYDVFSEETKKIGDGIHQIMKPIRSRGKNNVKKFEDYMLHRLNIDRMTLEERSLEWTKADREALEAIKEDITKRESEITRLEQEAFYLGNSKEDMQKKEALHSEIESLAEENRKSEREAKKLEAKIKERLLENKPIFGENENRASAITAEESRKIVKKYESVHPDWNETAEKIYTYLRALNHMRVEAGLITAEQEAYMNELYPHYVPAYRDFSYSGIGAVKGSRNLEVSKTVKKAKGGGQDISEFEQSIAEQTEQLMRAGRINQLANAIYEAATASNDDTYVEIVNEPKESSPAIEMTEDILSQNAVKVAKMSPVAKLTGNEFSSDGKGTLQEKVVSFFDSFGNKVKTKEIGIVDVTKSSFRDDKAHGLTRNKVISFKSIPEVLSNGRVIDVYHPDGKPYERITIAAPVMIGSEKYYVGVMVQKDNQSNRMYLHDLITEKATLSFNTEPTAENGEGIRDKGHLFITSILKNALKVNSSAKNSENLGSQDDIYDAFNRDTEVQQKNKNNQITFYKDGEKITMNVSREIFLGFEEINIFRQVLIFAKICDIIIS